jgi:hypothetical protein
MVLTAGALTYYKSQEEYEANAKPRKDVVVPLRLYVRRGAVARALLMQRVRQPLWPAPRRREALLATHFPVNARPLSLAGGSRGRARHGGAAADAGGGRFSRRHCRGRVGVAPRLFSAAAAL